MKLVRDDPIEPDPAFARLYAALPDARDLWPWSELTEKVSSPVLYLGIGAGRLAVPLMSAGVELVGVDSHPDMLARLRARAPGMELIESRIETLELSRRFELVLAPSNILFTVDRLRGAARHLAPSARLAIELTNPHWLRRGPDEGVRVLDFDGNQATLDVDYQLADGSVVTQRAHITLIWPEEAANWLAAAAGLRLLRMFGRRGAGLDQSPSYFIEAAPREERSQRAATVSRL